MNDFCKKCLEGLYMSAKWEKQEGNTGTLTVEVPAEEVPNFYVGNFQY